MAKKQKEQSKHDKHILELGKQILENFKKIPKQHLTALITLCFTVLSLMILK